MIEKKFKLKTRDVLFLSRKRQFFSKGYFGIFYYKQYTNLNYNQISVHISIKYNKKAVYRNILKRAVFDFISENSLIENKISGSFYKIFIILNKNKIDELKKNFENFDKKAISNYTKEELRKSFISFQDYLGKQ
ncbi:hypothetical protein K9M48_05515 [Candidatus Gracilibacteria bacterium]|nr:hypothetical protein [Candidatus Gracilibacteria bacterium]